jgi:hypothetical protein
MTGKGRCTGFLVLPTGAQSGNDATLTGQVERHQDPRQHRRRAERGGCDGRRELYAAGVTGYRSEGGETFQLGRAGLAKRAPEMVVQRDRVEPVAIGGYRGLNRLVQISRG